MVVSVVVILAVTALLGLWLHSCSSGSIKTELWDHTERVTKLAELNLATRQTTENLTQTETRAFLRGLISSSAVYEVSWSVTYTYHIDARPHNWKVTLTDGVLYVEAPGIEAGMPAVDSSTVRGKVDKGWLIFKQDEKLAKLISDLTPISVRRSNDAAHIAIVRDSCRASLESFFSEWLAVVGKRANIRQVHVRFLEEPNPGTGTN